MFAQKNILLFWITFITPSLICYTMKWIYKDRIQIEEIFEIVKVHEALTGIQTILTIYTSFVPFYSYRFECWNKIGGLVHLIAIHVTFIVCPIIGIV